MIKIELDNYYNKYSKYQNKNAYIEQSGGINFFSKKEKQEIIPLLVTPNIFGKLLETKEIKFGSLSVKIEKYEYDDVFRGDQYNGRGYTIKKQNMYVYI